jgi:alginate O-acetyltransferase complex protein AlgJ
MPPKIDLSREEAAQREVGETSFSPGTRSILIIAFILTLLAVSLIQAWMESSSSSPRCLEIWKSLPRALHAFQQSTILIPAITAANESLKKDFKNYEKSLEEESFLMQQALPPMQHFTLKYLGLGNEKVYPGRSGWLYYRPDVDYVTGPGFLQASERLQSAKSLSPLPALIRFRKDLAAHGIRLILLPVPVKPVIDPESLSKSAPQLPLQNSSFPAFLAELDKNGIEYIDPTARMISAKQSQGTPQFLKTDSHWTPESMEAVAREVAYRIDQQTHERRNPVRGESLEIKNHGDLVAMLRLPDPDSLYPAETARITPVRQPDGSDWQPSPTAEILLLGDSFTNIYSTKDLGWGTSAGLAEHLSLALQMPVDRIAINAGGALTSRQTLARSPERLTGKKVVVYEFAVRDLAVGDWKVLSLPETKVAILKEKSPRQTLRGTIKDITRAPKPGTVPYKDLIVCIHLTDIEGGNEREALVFLQGLKNNVPTAANTLNPGDKISIEPILWSTVEDKLGSINRREFSGSAADLDVIYWAEDVPVVEP